MNITKEQAQAFLDSLWPCGEMSYLSNHTRSYLSGIVGNVPKFLAHQKDEGHKALAQVLRAIAEHLEIDETDPNPF